jgi:hypothetical protein
MTAEYDIHRKSYKYSIDDWQILVNILREYGDKLMNLSRQMSAERNKPSGEFVIMRSKFKAAIFAATFTTSLFFSLFLLSRKSFTTMNVTELLYAFFIIIVPILVLTFPIIFEKTRQVDTCIPFILLEQDAQLLSSRLESAIRLTIAVSDQVEISLAKKLEMDLRIDEAKSALEYYYSVVGSKKAS